MITSPGIGSGLDIESIVTQLVTLEGQAPGERLARREAGFQAELSGLGTFRSALENLRSALLTLKDPTKFNTRTASSSDEEIFTVSADNTVAPSTYDIEVLSLAQVQKLSSTAYVDAGTFVGTGTLQISIDGVTRSIDIEGPGETPEDDGTYRGTLAHIRDEINSVDNNPGVVASIVNAEGGSYLVLTGTQTGAAKTIELTVTGGDGGLATLVGGLTEQQAAADAEITIDSFTHRSKTNIVSDAIDGLTIELQSADPGTTATLSIGLDRGAARDRVEDFVNAYNALRTTTNELTRYNPETGETGLLQGRSIVSSLLNRLSGEFNETVLGPLTSLRDLGMSIALDGKIELDDSALDEILDSDFESVSNLFADKSNGAAVRFDALLDDYLKFDGLLDNRENGLEASIETVNIGRERLEIRLTAVEQRLRKQFLALDQLISELNSTSGFLATQLSNLVSPSALLGGN